jgi:hypothetical protein
MITDEQQKINIENGLGPNGDWNYNNWLIWLEKQPKVINEGWRAVEKATGQERPEFWVEKNHDRWI